jgi:hypothetical protein
VFICVSVYHVCLAFGRGICVLFLLRAHSSGRSVRRDGLVWGMKLKPTSTLTRAGFWVMRRVVVVCRGKGTLHVMGSRGRQDRAIAVGSNRNSNVQVPRKV